MGNEVTIRAAEPHEANWVNERYAGVRFIPSELPRDLVLIAHIDNEPAGLGRLVPVDDDSVELGGMLVFDEFRGRGVAKALIDALIAATEKSVYCIPFAKLEALYASAGFARTETAPVAVLEKYEWCLRTYDEPVLLMVFRQSRAVTAAPVGHRLPV